MSFSARYTVPFVFVSKTTVMPFTEGRSVGHNEMGLFSVLKDICVANSNLLQRLELHNTLCFIKTGFLQQRVKLETF